MRRTTLGALNGPPQSSQKRERKKSLGARASTGGRPSMTATSKRRSSQYGRESHGPGQTKDQRNLSDRGVYRKNIRYLMEFLTEYNYPNPISERILSAPSMKEFKKIFLFTYKFINPVIKDSVVDKKPEEEIPRIFKLLGYPFPISKTSMFSVGSPHTWPNLLGALCWLIELTKLSLNVAEDIEGKTMFPDDDCGAVGLEGQGYLNRYYFQYLEESYAAFMMGKELDELDDIQQCFFNKIKAQNATTYQEIEAIEDENTQLEQELEQLEGQSELESIVLKQKSLETDREKFKKYIEDLKRHSKKLSDSNAVQEDEINALKMEFEAISLENNNLQIILDNQELSAADVERLKKDKQEFIKQLQFFEKQRDQIDQQIWGQEMQYAKIHEGAEQSIREYNEFARKLVPGTADNASGFDFEIHFNPQQPDIAGEFKDQLKPALLVLQERVMERTRQLQTELITEDEAIDQLGDMINEKQEELDVMTAKQTAFDKEFELNKEAMTKEYQNATSVVEEQEAKLLNMKREVHDVEKQRREQLRELEMKSDQRLTELKEEINEWKNFLLKACHLVMEHKASISKCIKEIEEKATAALQETKNLKLPQVCEEIMNHETEIKDLH